MKYKVPSRWKGNSSDLSHLFLDLWKSRKYKSAGQRLICLVEPAKKRV